MQDTFLGNTRLSVSKEAMLWEKGTLGDKQWCIVAEFTRFKEWKQTRVYFALRSGDKHKVFQENRTVRTPW